MSPPIEIHNAETLYTAEIIKLFDQNFFTPKQWDNLYNELINYKQTDAYHKNKQYTSNYTKQNLITNIMSEDLYKRMTCIPKPDTIVQLSDEERTSCIAAAVEANELCPILHEPLQDGYCSVTPCRHVFSSVGLDEWRKRANGSECPMCRSKI